MENSVAIVTGASQGIGRPTAIRLARDFSVLVLAARNAKALEEVATSMDQPPGTAQESPAHSKDVWREGLTTYSYRRILIGST